ncbi:hypothetical protein [Labrys wisconsinensis]|uniref:Cucumopine synthase C-terminal helical bundle domain-containing protein n=1 Tax=Labrys wisconsinensis TaxID=425677 RepID=A0ABU0J6L1_9HYPH|nr:hypothetical protein [Labrys wisconsinensis]MDQ0469897.1 hypothetical protein [Labrys wisconsinensis]
MSDRSLSEVVRAIREETDKIRAAEPEEVYKIRTGAMDNQAGTNGQYFTTWDFANGMIRDMSMYTWYHFVELAEDESFSLDQLCAVVNLFDHPYSNYLRYSGFPKLGGFALALRRHLPSAASRQDAVEAVRAMCAYTNLLSAWSFHYFPWNLGAGQFGYAAPGEPLPSLSDLSRRVAIRDGRRVRLTWKPLGITVEAILAVRENPDLCEDIVAALPFTILQDHAVVSGEAIYAWAPVVSTAPVQVKERQCDAPVGRIRFSQGTGNKLIIQYGAATEDIATPVLGEVVPEHKDRLVEVGRHVMKSTFETKEPIWLEVALA